MIPDKPKKMLKKYEEEHFTTASQGWDSHTMGLKGELTGFDKACDLYEAREQAIIKALEKIIHGFSEKGYRPQLNQLIQDIKGGA